MGLLIWTESKDTDVMRSKAEKDLWLLHTRYLRPWIHKATYQWMELGRKPHMAAWIMPSYYSDVKDMEVAAMVAMIMRDGAGLDARCREMRVALGSTPMKWFESRGFVTLGLGDRQDWNLGGVKQWRLSRLLGDLWEGYTLDGGWHLESTNTEEERRRLLRLSLCDIGIWECDDLKVPLFPDVVKLLKAFWPRYDLYGSPDDAVKLFGFERDVDFFYFYLAFEDMRRKNPKACSRLINLFGERYRKCKIMKGRYWHGRYGILPKIEF